MAIYKRLGMAQTCALVRWARPLRAPRKIEALVRSKPIARALQRPVEIALAYWGWKGDRKSADLQLHDGQCGDEFDRLNEQICRMPGVVTVRTAQYLNWRYLANPTAKYEILAARQAGVLVGYAVFLALADEGRIVDVCAPDQPGLVALLLAGAVQHLSSRGASTVSMNAGEFHPWRDVFHRSGFRPRESSPVVTC